MQIPSIRISPQPNVEYEPDHAKNELSFLPQNVSIQKKISKSPITFWVILRTDTHKQKNRRTDLIT